MALLPKFSPIEFTKGSVDGSVDGSADGSADGSVDGSADVVRIKDLKCDILGCECMMFDPTDFGQLLDWCKKYFSGSDSLIVQTFKTYLPIHESQKCKKEVIVRYVYVPYIRIHYYLDNGNVCTHLFYIYLDKVHHLCTSWNIDVNTIPFKIKIMGNISDYFSGKL